MASPYLRSASVRGVDHPNGSSKPELSPDQFSKYFLPKQFPFFMAFYWETHHSLEIVGLPKSNMAAATKCMQCFFSLE